MDGEGWEQAGAAALRWIAVDYYLNRNHSKFFLGALVLAQLVLLGYQVRRPDAGGIRLVRLWSVEAILPVERVSQRVVVGTQGLFHGYFLLRQVNRQDQALKAQVAALELQNQQLRESVRELPHLDALLNFQRAYGLRTEAAQVISSGASADAQAVYLDRGSGAGLARNMAVITPDGVVGKLSHVLSSSAQVLLVTDPESGAGALIGAAGVHGILRGLGAGRVEVRNVLKDEPVAVGASIITSGEDQVYPKGIPIGTVTGTGPSTDGVFKTVQVKLAADLGRLEQVLVVIGSLPPPTELPDSGLTAAAIRQARLPSLPGPAAGSTAGVEPASGASRVTSSATPAPPDTPPAEGDALGVPPGPKPTAPAAPPAATPAKPKVIVHGGGR